MNDPFCIVNTMVAYDMEMQVIFQSQHQER